MTDIPEEVNAGKIVGKFVSFYADSADEGEIPDEVPLSGTVILTPTTLTMRWPGTNPPRTAVVQSVSCPVIDGFVCEPGATSSNDQGVYVVATDQPEAEPNKIQWTASFRFNGVTAQLPAITFNVPVNGVIDLSQVIPATPQPGETYVTSSEDRILAQAAAVRAEAAADEAEILVGDAETITTRIDALEIFTDARISGLITDFDTLETTVSNLSAGTITTDTEGETVQSWMDSIEATLAEGVVSTVNGKSGTSVTLTGSDIAYKDAETSTVAEQVDDINSRLGTPTASDNAGEIVRRNASGNASVSDPKASSHIATRGYVDSFTPPALAIGGRLGSPVAIIADLNDATETGRYQANNGTANTPDFTGSWMVDVTQINSGTVTQVASHYGSLPKVFDQKWERRYSTALGWGRWYLRSMDPTTFTPNWVGSGMFAGSIDYATYSSSDGMASIELSQVFSSGGVYGDLQLENPLAAFTTPPGATKTIMCAGRFTSTGTSSIATPGGLLASNGQILYARPLTVSDGQIVQKSFSSSNPGGMTSSGRLSIVWTFPL